MSVIDEVKGRVDIVDLISRYTTLKKAGSTYKGLCPFHSERTPSFIVFPHTGTWHCFGACGTGGDAFSFLMRAENADFREALETLANEVGVELEPPGADPAKEERSSLYEVNQAAAEYFHTVLLRHPAANGARAYLKRRGIDNDVAGTFQLGYARDSWNSLNIHLTEQGFEREQQLAAGLLKYNEERESTYDAFRNRVIVPILDRQSRVIGFGGRVLDDSQPKYLNTAETPLFHKSRVIYGLDAAYRAIGETDEVVIVEGYMDVIAAHQFGFTNVVACMGTSLTTEQLQQLQRYTNNFVLALDADAAGQQATIRGLNQARSALARISKPTVTPRGQVRIEERLGANLRIISMPDGNDPDDVIRTAPEHWKELVQSAPPLVDFYLAVVAEQYDLQSAQGKGAAVAELAPLIAELNDDIERQHYIQLLSRMVQIDEMTIAGRIQAAAKTSQAKSAQQPRRRTQPTAWSARQEQQPPEFSQGPTPVDREPPPLDMDAGAPPPSMQATFETTAFDLEDQLLANLLQTPDLLIWLAETCHQLNIDSLQTGDLQNAENQEIFRTLKQYISSDEPWDLEAYQEMLTDHVHGRLAHLLAYSARLPEQSPAAMREYSVKALLRLRTRRLSRDIQRIKFLLDEAQNIGDSEAIRHLSTINNQTLREKFHLDHIFVNIGNLLYNKERNGSGIQIY